jgi:hypothetical protein
VLSLLTVINRKPLEKVLRWVLLTVIYKKTLVKVNVQIIDPKYISVAAINSFDSVSLLQLVYDLRFFFSLSELGFNWYIYSISQFLIKLLIDQQPTTISFPSTS